MIFFLFVLLNSIRYRWMSWTKHSLWIKSHVLQYERKLSVYRYTLPSKLSARSYFWVSLSPPRCSRFHIRCCSSYRIVECTPSPQHKRLDQIYAPIQITTSPSPTLPQSGSRNHESSMYLASLSTNKGSPPPPFKYYMLLQGNSMTLACFSFPIDRQV